MDKTSRILCGWVCCPIDRWVSPEISSDFCFDGGFHRVWQLFVSQATQNSSSVLVLYLLGWISFVCLCEIR